MRVRPYWRVLPRARFYVAKRPRAGCIATTSVVVLLLLLSARSLFSQVTAVAALKNGAADLFVGNPTSGPLSVTVSLFRDATPTGGPVTLGDSVAALITPRTFTLGPGEMQTVRLRVREPVAPGELLRLVTLLDPSIAPDSSQGVRLVFRTRLITKVRAVP
jgi:hypothetical protein